MGTANFNLPKISLNGKELPIKDLYCRKIEITKEVGNIDVINMELIGHVEIEPINAECIYLKVYDPPANKYFRFRVTDFMGLEDGDE